MTYWLGKQIGKIFVVLPCWLQRSLENVFGWLAWQALSQRRKHKAMENVRLALGVSEDEARQIVKDSMTRFGRMMAMLFHYPRFSRTTVEKMVRFHGLEHLDEALARGKGVVLSSGHCGNWELLGSSLQLMGYPIVAVIRPQRNKGFDQLIHEYRSHIGGVILQKTDVRSIVRQLKENRMPFILSDQDAGAAGIFVKFFGRWASTPTGAAVLARMSGAPIVTTFITEGADGIHDLYLSKPLYVDMEGDKEKVIYDVMQQLTIEVEEHIRRHPGEWFWLQDRWRTRKPEE